MKKLLTLFSGILLVTATHTAKAQTQVTFYTSMGDFVVEMYDTLTPVTSGNFIDLVRDKFYDGVIFHRVIDNFMIQGGDPTGTGSGGPGYSIPDEFDSSLSNIQKTISMANSGPNTGGSQFFINLVNNTYLDFDKAPFTSKHPVFGFVVSGFSVVQSIGKVSTDGSDRPLTDVVMDSLRVTKAVWLGIGKRNDEALPVNVYPNPVTDASVLNLQSASAKTVDITIHDQLGKVLYAGSLRLNAGYNSIRMNDWTETWSPGIYFIRVSDGTTTTAVKSIKLR